MTDTICVRIGWMPTDAHRCHTMILILESINRMSNNGYSNNGYGNNQNNFFENGANSEDLEQLIRNGLVRNHTDKSRLILLEKVHYAVSNGDINAEEAIELMNMIVGNMTNVPGTINQPDSDGNTFLHLICELSDPLLIEWALQHGADPNLANEDGDTPFHFYLGSFPENSHNLQTIALFMTHGADINLQNRGGNTPLHEYMTVHARYPVVQELIRTGADLNLQNEAGKTSLGMLLSFLILTNPQRGVSNPHNIQEIIHAFIVNGWNPTLDPDTEAASQLRALGPIADMLRDYLAEYKASNPNWNKTESEIFNKKAAENREQFQKSRGGRRTRRKGRKGHKTRRALKGKKGKKGKSVRRAH